jgi:long-chain acyl-CoA synthetase
VTAERQPAGSRDARTSANASAPLAAPGAGRAASRPAGRIAAWIARQVERGLAETELTLPQYRVLGLLAEGNALPSSLADKLDVRRPSITAVVDGLVARGLVTRTPAEDDRRQVSHAITPAGAALLAAADADVNARLAEIAACLDSEDEARRALEAIELWGKALRNWRHTAVAGAAR